MIEPDDHALMLAAIRGDENAFGILFHRHSPALKGFARRMLDGNEADAEDVTQETWVQAFTSYDRSRCRSLLRSWLFGIALNVVRSQFWRKRKDILPECSEEAEPVKSDEKVDLERAVSRLPDGFRAVLVLHDIYGFKHYEIANMLGIATGTSKSQLNRARQAVRMSIGSGYRSYADAE